MYEAITINMLIVTAGLWIIGMYQLWAPFLKAYVKDEDLFPYSVKYLPIDFSTITDGPDLIFNTFFIGVLGGFLAIFAAGLWPITLPLVIAFGTLTALRHHNRIKRKLRECEERKDD